MRQHVAVDYTNAAAGYDVCLSFSGKDRPLVDQVAQELQRRSVRVFYDRFQQVELWGKELHEYLDQVYQHRARFAVPFLSVHYAESDWARQEMVSALNRAMRNKGEYILPVRLDDTLFAGLSESIGWVDMGEQTPASLAELVCRKLGIATEGDGTTIRWATSPVTFLGDQLVTYQGVAVAPALTRLEEVVRRGVRSLAARASHDVETVWWTTKEDRRFDRLYATSTVAVTLSHLGVRADGPLLGPAIDFLASADPADLDDRAGPMGLLSLGRLDPVGTAVLLGALAERQIPEGSHRGSFNLVQGPAARDDDGNWTAGPMHDDGASFHACHVADLLLHIPGDQPDNRRLAAPLLDGIRCFLGRTLADNGGKLLDHQGRLTQRTLYGYALCPMLSLPLPVAWPEVAQAVLDAVAADRSPSLTRCFAMMNCAYFGSRGPEVFRPSAADWVSRELDLVVALVEDPDPVRSALALRALAYGAELIDPRLGGYARAAGRSAAEL